MFILLFCLIFAVLSIGQFREVPKVIEILEIPEIPEVEIEMLPDIIEIPIPIPDTQEEITRDKILRTGFKVADMKQFIKIHNLQTRLKKQTGKSLSKSNKEDLIRFLF